MTKSLVKGSVWSLGGMILGTLIGLVGYPLLVHGLGPDRFGITSIAGAVVGYFMVFDLGLGRASVVVLGAALESRDPRKISGLFWSGQILMMALGSLGAIALVATAPILCHRALHIPPPLVQESIWRLALVSFSIPVMITFSAQISFLGCLGRFGTLNAVRTCMNILSWVAPLVALRFYHSLVATFGAMLVARILVGLISLSQCIRLEPSLRRPCLASWQEFSPMVKQGGWMSVLNLVAPFMAYMDRTLVGVLANLSAVTSYSVAGDTTQKLWIFQASISGTLFQILPGQLAISRSKGLEMCRSALRLLSLSMVPSALLASAFGHVVLRRWLGGSIGESAYAPYKILLVGIFLNSFAYVPFTLIASEGRSRFSALLNLAELPFFLALLYIFVPKWGATGAALAWTIRVLFDTVIHFYGGRAPFGAESKATWGPDFLSIAATAAVLSVSCLPMGDAWRAALNLVWLALWTMAFRRDLLSRAMAVREKVRLRFGM